MKEILLKFVFEEVMQLLSPAIHCQTE